MRGKQRQRIVTMIEQWCECMKTIRVVAAIICDNMAHPTRIFATARGYGEFKGKWEFPGGHRVDREDQKCDGLTGVF